MTDRLLVYGSYGYAGALVVERALDQGLSPVLAGRSPEKIERQAMDLGLDYRVFSLEHPEVIEARIADVDAVLNCAGPFAETAVPLIDACLATGTDYVDLDGEIDTLEATAARDTEAESADVTLLPGAGFDVVPTDCLAAHLEAELPSATRLTLALDGLGTFSPGTVKSILDELPRACAIRENGAVRDVPAAYRTRQFDFGDGELELGVTVPWGDVSTAYYATGIGNIEVYATVPEFAVETMRRTRPLLPVLGLDPVKRGLKRLADAVVTGPTAAQRARSTTRVWGEVANDDGDRAAAYLRTPDTYDVAPRTAVEAARRVAAGDAPTGFQTPASAFGPDFVLAFDGVERVAATDRV